MLSRIKYLLFFCIALTGCIFNSTSDDSACALSVEGDSEDCRFNRPCEITPISKKNLLHVGFNNWVKMNTPDSLIQFIDSSFFSLKITEYGGHLPLKYPYYLQYYSASDYFTLQTGDCEYSSLAEIDSVYTFDEIFQIAISDNHIFMATYDDDLSFMNSEKLEIEYYISDLDFKNVDYYSNKSNFLKTVDSITHTSLSTAFEDKHFGAKDFIDWYKDYAF